MLATKESVSQQHAKNQQHAKGIQRPLWEGRTERDQRPGGVPMTLNAEIAVESTLDKLVLLKMRLSTIAGSWTTSPQRADRQFQLKVQLYDRERRHIKTFDMIEIQLSTLTHNVSYSYEHV